MSAAEALGLDLPTLVVLALATFRLTRLVTTDVIFNGLRERLWRRFPPESTALGYLSTCDWCASVWTGSLLAVAYTMIPTVTLVAALALALSAVTGILAARL